ncbi:uncharacterized protein SOCE26_012440 [Sorangium cellulosum]|uniref:Uncharacterized protein n=1 Tax=Sorangium cellulosum TaxID=56 RepID=A0A2L0EKN3_SORCE|nr:hypothetical protein [Sorangium cellulosum]AUX39849.1 uncharacterized protein SOCE26_012440 [Sorangium cellulosum]
MTSPSPQADRPAPLARRRAPRSLAESFARAAGVLGLCALAVCDSLDNIDVEVGGMAVVPPGTVVEEVLGSLDFPAFQSIDLSAEFENQGVTKDDVDEVHLLEFTLRIESPADGDFDFLSSVSFFAETEGQPRVLIAEFDEVPRGARELSMEVIEGVDLKPYVVAPKMTITSEARVNGRPAEETTIAADVLLDVDVSVPGC